MRLVTQVVAAVLTFSSARYVYAQDEIPKGVSNKADAESPLRKKVNSELIDTGTKSDSETEDKSKLKFSGYVYPFMSVRYRPDALPQQRWDAGAAETYVGFVLEGEPLPYIGYFVEIGLNVARVRALTSASAVDKEGDGTIDTLATKDSSVLGEIIEEATGHFIPTSWSRIKLGRMRVPFTVQALSPLTDLMFPQRPAPTTIFLSGTDLGALAEVTPLDGLIEASVGMFNGRGNITSGDRSERGWLYAARVDVNPLGEVPNNFDLKRGGPKVGVGAGATHYTAKVFDSAGFVNSKAKEMRLSASLRFSFWGLFLQGEWMTWRRTDNVNERDDRNTGGYVQGSFYLPFTSTFGIAPKLRYGSVQEDRSFLPRRTRWVEAGLSTFFGKEEPGDVGRLNLSYTGEIRETEGETAHGATLSYLIKF
ncbi:MAG: hypothetical protein R3C68_00060 [Myxococcota bacterium]